MSGYPGVRECVSFALVCDTCVMITTPRGRGRAVMSCLSNDLPLVHFEFWLQPTTRILFLSQNVLFGLFSSVHRTYVSPCQTSHVHICCLFNGSCVIFSADRRDLQRWSWFRVWRSSPSSSVLFLRWQMLFGRLQLQTASGRTSGRSLVFYLELLFASSFPSEVISSFAFLLCLIFTFK